MAKRAKQEEIDRWREDYLRLRQNYSNKEMAEKLGLDEGNLSAYGLGTKTANGKPSNPGAEFIKRFYITYAAELQELDHKTSSSKRGKKTYNPKSNPIPESTEGQLRYLNASKNVAERDTANNDFLRSNFTEIVGITKTMADTQKESVQNQGQMIKTQDRMVQSHDKTVDAHRDMTRSFLLLAETIRDQFLASRPTNPGQENVSPQA